MPMRVLAGVALWLALAALPVSHSALPVSHSALPILHLDLRVPLVLAALLPLPLLFVRKTPVPFLLAFLPLAVLEPDLFSPRVHGTVGILGASGLLAVYIVLSLHTPTPPVTHPTEPKKYRRMGPVLSATAAALCALAVLVPYLGPVAGALRRGYPATAGAATVLLAIAALALVSGLVLVYLAAPLDDAAKRRS